ncbi:MAG: hypothetical protein AAB330_00035, partial [Bacteroidota bacterium]
MLGFIGEYAHNNDTLYVMENGQKLILQTKKDEIFPLEFQNGGSFRFAAGKLSNEAGGVFEQNNAGVATRLKLGPRLFARLFLGGEGGGTFRITPLRPVDDLKREALNA